MCSTNENAIFMLVSSKSTDQSMPRFTPEQASSLPWDCAWVSLSSGTMGGEVWRPALNQISRNIRSTALGWEYGEAGGGRWLASRGSGLLC